DLERLAFSERLGASLDAPAPHCGREEGPGRADVAQLLRDELAARLELLREELGASHAVEAKASLGVARPIPAVDVPPGQLPLERMRLDHADARLLADGRVLDLHEPLLGDGARESGDELLFLAQRDAIGRRLDVELSERLRELAPHAVELRVRLG